MKLRRIEINRFRSINEVDIKIKSMSVLIGENNAGKSNILKAIELFYEDSVRGINEEYFHFKDQSKPIEIILTFSELTEEEKRQPHLKNWVYENKIRIKKVIEWDSSKNKYLMTLYAWQAKPLERHFDLSKFDEFKGEIKEIVEENGLPDYFRTDRGTVTQASYKAGVERYIEEGLVEFGDPDWIKNPGGYKEVFASLLPRFYMLPAVKDAQDESKTTQQTVLGKLITDLTQRIISRNPKFEEVQQQIDGLKKYLNKDEEDDSERLQEIKDLENELTTIISESMPGSKVEIEIVTPELIDLFKDTRIKLDDSIPTSINAKGHGLQRALIFAYIRAYAKILNSTDENRDHYKNIILGIEEPELFLHPIRIVIILLLIVHFLWMRD